MSIYLRAVSFMASMPRNDKMLRLSDVQVYLSRHKSLMMSHEFQHQREDIDPLDTKFRESIDMLTSMWWREHSEAVHACTKLIAFHNVKVTTEATKARVKLSMAREAVDAMTALELRRDVRNHLTAGYRHRGRVMLLINELVAHPAPGSIPRVKRPYIRRVV